MPRVEAYRCRFTGQIFTNRLEWSNHLLFQRDVERERRDARKTNVDPAHLSSLWKEMRDDCTTFEEISEFVVKHGREFGYFFASKTKDFQRKYGNGQKVIDWPTVRQFKFVKTEYYDNMDFGDGITRTGWMPALSYDIDHCFPDRTENIFENTGFIVNRRQAGLDLVELVMFTDSWQGLCGPVAIEILSRPMKA